MLTLVIFLRLLNALFPILVSSLLSANVSVWTLIHPLNARLPMVFTDAGITMDSIEPYAGVISALNTEAPMAITDLPCMLAWQH